MLKKNNGYFLAELLLTLTAWIMIAGVVLPLIMKVMNESIQAEQKIIAEKLLYETLIVAKKEGFLPVQETFVLYQTEYEITNQLLAGETLMEVCIQYADVHERTNKQCELFK